MTILDLPTEIIQYIIGGGGFLNAEDIANIAEAVQDRPALIDRLRLIPLMKTQIKEVFQADEASPIIDRLSFYELRQLTRCASENYAWNPTGIIVIDQVMCQVLQTVGEKWRDFFDVLALNYVPVSNICFTIFKCQNNLQPEKDIIFDAEELNYQHYLLAEYAVDNHLLLRVMRQYINVDGPKYLYYCLINLVMFNTPLIRPDIIQMIIPAYVPFHDTNSDFLADCVMHLSYEPFRVFLRENENEYLKFKMAVNYYQEQCTVECLLEDNYIDYYLGENFTAEVKAQKTEAWEFYREL